jgi:hypothetical protein
MGNRFCLVAVKKRRIYASRRESNADTSVIQFVIYILYNGCELWNMIKKYMYWQILIPVMVRFMGSIQIKYGQILFVWHQEVCSNQSALSYLIQFRPEYISCYGRQELIPEHSVGFALTRGQVLLQGQSTFHKLFMSTYHLLSWDWQTGVLPNFQLQVGFYH